MSTKAIREALDELRAYTEITGNRAITEVVRAASSELEAIEKAARDVAAFVDWTQNGGPMQKHVAALDTDGIRLLRAISKQER